MACCLACVSGLWLTPSLEDSVWIMTSSLARRMVSLDSGVLPRLEYGVYGLWRAASPRWCCVWIIALCFARSIMVCLDYGVQSLLEDGVSGL
jgi:hypothetical protein